ncbi:MAG: hypothetical protein LC722_02865, partial [Actinobacteria bacterium]|nr:hypothetical protein [Actinomycetota bacterium]
SGMTRRLLVALGAFALITSGVSTALALPPGGVTIRESGSTGARALLVGAAKKAVTPFTIVPGATEAVNPNSDPSASNPDGTPGGLWDTFEPEAGFSSTGQITSTGVWGEPFTDANDNGRYDLGELFVDDPVNTRLDPDSAGTYDGIYMAGFGSDRVAGGAFDPLWARALYVRDAKSGETYAQVTLDFIGYFSDWNWRIEDLIREMDPAIDLDHLIISHTHNHEAPDVHVGLWGRDVYDDGTYPKYERYVEVKVAQAVVAAARGAQPARFRFGSMRPGEKYRTLRGNVEDLAGMQTRNSCRTPWNFDDELRAAQMVSTRTGRTIATIVNWGTHVESLEDRNVFLSSDYAHAARGTLEQAFGGVALQLQGAQGGVEIIGDSCVRRWQRKRFDGETFPVTKDGESVAVEHADTDPKTARRRTYAIGRVVGNGAVAALKRARWDRTATSIQGFRSADLYVPVNNEGLTALTAIGVIDKPSYVAKVSLVGESHRETGMTTSPPAGIDAKTTLFGWRIGSASFLTAPGELFPEIYWGLKKHNRGTDGGRKHHMDYVRSNPAALACARKPWSYGDEPGAHTGRPYEPGVREAQVRAFRTKHNFLIGYTPDLLGYIVPGYDFAWFAAPPADGVGLGALHGVWDGDEAPDPCREHSPDLGAPEAHYNTHYQETNSAGSMLAPAYACSVWELLGLDPATSAEGGAACEEWHQWQTAGLLHFGLDPSVCDQTSETDCVRHY